MRFPTGRMHVVLGVAVLVSMLIGVFAEESMGSIRPRSGEVAYTHDKAGNRLTRTSTLAGIASQVFTYDNNARLNGDTTDNNGNTKVSDPTRLPSDAIKGTDSYDNQDRLTTREASDGSTVTILYDGDGNRVGQTVTKDGLTTTTTYLVDTLNPTGYSQVLEEQVNGQVTRVYLFGHDLIAQDTRTTPGVNATWERLWYGYDGHGNTRFLTDGTGEAVEAYNYEAFGQLLKSWSPAAPGVQVSTTRSHFLYCGEQYDQALGLYHLRARLMNPLTGRFWTLDEYEGANEEPATLHKYLYVHGDPLNWVDPTGFEKLEVQAIKTAVISTISKIGAQVGRAAVRKAAKKGGV